MGCVLFFLAKKKLSTTKKNKKNYLFSNKRVNILAGADIAWIGPNDILVCEGHTIIRVAIFVVFRTKANLDHLMENR